MTRRVEVSDLGRMDYKPCWDLQEEVFQGMVKAKIARRNAGLSTTDPGPDGQPDLALPLSRMYWVEHPHVLTLGKSGASANVVAPPERLAELGVQYFPITAAATSPTTARASSSATPSSTSTSFLRTSTSTSASSKRR